MFASALVIVGSGFIASGITDLNAIHFSLGSIFAACGFWVVLRDDGSNGFKD